MSNNNFKPIYIMAQAIDNVSEDDFYEFSQQNGLKFVEDISFVQKKILEINGVMQNYSSNNIFNNNLIKKLKIIRMNKWRDKIFIIIESNDRDNVGRKSNINVFLDVFGVDFDNLDIYKDYLYRGLSEFCQKTNRNIDGVDDVKSVEFNKIFGLDNFMKKNLDFSYILSAICFVLIVVLIYLFLNRS